MPSTDPGPKPPPRREARVKAGTAEVLGFARETGQDSRRGGPARGGCACSRARVGRGPRRGVLGRIRLGTAGKSPRLRRWVLAAALLGVALVPYPVQGAAGVPPATACRSGCRGGVANMVRWTTPLSGAWNVAPGLAGMVPAAGLAYAAVGGGLAAVGAGLTVTAYSSRTGALEWQGTPPRVPPRGAPPCPRAPAGGGGPGGCFPPAARGAHPRRRPARR